MIPIRVILFNLALSALAQAKSIPDVYLKVADGENIPADILYAIALTESGYQYGSIYNPWPWTLNIEGKAYRFNSYQLTLAALEAAIQANKSVDAGVMQINWYWHQDKFPTVAAILDPYTNLQQGARILLAQYRLAEDWWVAVGRYHAPGKDSQSVKRAERYRKRVHKQWHKIKSELKSHPVNHYKGNKNE